MINLCTDNLGLYMGLITLYQKNNISNLSQLKALADDKVNMTLSRKYTERKKFSKFLRLWHSSINQCH